MAFQEWLFSDSYRVFRGCRLSGSFGRNHQSSVVGVRALMISCRFRVVKSLKGSFRFWDFEYCHKGSMYRSS